MATIKARNISIRVNGQWYGLSGNTKMHIDAQWVSGIASAAGGARIRYNGNWYYTWLSPMVIVGDGNIMYSDGGATWV
jgi:hypothetical protein